MFAITIVPFVVVDDPQIVTIRYFSHTTFPLFRNQNLNIQKRGRNQISASFLKLYERIKESTLLCTSLYKDSISNPT